MAGRPVVPLPSSYPEPGPVLATAACKRASACVYVSGLWQSLRICWYCGRDMMVVAVAVASVANAA